MAETILIARIHELYYEKVYCLSERADRTFGPSIKEWQSTQTLPLDARWLPHSSTIASEPTDSVKTNTLCRDFHLVLLNQDAPIVNLRTVLEHALAPLTHDFHGKIYVYVEPNSDAPTTSLTFPPKNDPSIPIAIDQLSRLKYARDSEVCRAELRLTLRSMLAEGPQIPNSELFTELIASPNSTLKSAKSGKINAFLAGRNLMFDQIESTDLIPLGALEDVRFYLPPGGVDFGDDASAPLLTSYYDVTEVLHTFNIPVPSQSSTTSTQPIAPTPARKQQEDTLPQRPEPVPETPPKASTPPPTPWVPGRFFAGVTDLRNHPVPEEKAFVLNEPGNLIHTLDELSEAINLIDPVTFHNHVNAERNDFADWVEDAFGEKELADQLRKFPTPLRMMVSIEKFLRLAELQSP